MAHTAHGSTDRTSAPALLLALRATSVLTVLVIASQFVTAGPLVQQTPAAETAEGIHATGAIVLHVVSGLSMLAVAALWRAAGTVLWPTVVAALVFALSFAQAYLGSHGPIAVHVPGALVLTIGAVVVAAFSFSRGATGR